MLTSYERETIINFNEEEKTASIYTYNKALRNKLNKLVGVNPDIHVIRSSDEMSEFEVPKSWIKVSPPKQVNLSDEQRAAIAARLQASRNK